MTTSITMENLKSLITFPFNDKRWKNKLLVGSLLSIAGVVIFPYWFVLGYLYEIMRQIVVDHEEPTLPEWVDWGNLLRNGVRVFGVSFIYGLPSLLFVLIPQLIMFLTIPLSESGAVDDTISPLVVMPIFMILTGIGMVLGLICLFLSAVATGHMVAKDDFGAAFQIKEWWPILRKNFVGFLVSFVIVAGIYWITNMISQILIFTIVLCFLYPLITFFAYYFVSVIGAAMFAQAYAEGNALLSSNENLPNTAS